MKKEVIAVHLYLTGEPFAAVHRGERIRFYNLTRQRTCFLLKAVLNGSRKLDHYYGYINGPMFVFEPTNALTHEKVA